ncbi:MAG: family 43 glycosylhydrolase [Clostridia bacterium]|nr:family 43 glycosylhydrolase [Clostridia bacterium]
MKTVPIRSKILALFLALLCCALAIPPLPADAAETTVYLDPANGSDAASGKSPTAALATLPAAIKAVASGGRIVLMSALSLTGSASEQFVEPTHAGEIVITSVDGGTDYRASGAVLSLQGGMVYALGGPTVFEELKINTGSGNTVIAARFNALTMGEGLTMTSSNLILLGGYEGPKKGTPTNRNSSLTVKSGTYRFLVGFSRNKGDGNLTYTGTARITVEGGTITEIYGASTVNHYSGSLSVKISGGKVTTLHTGGDVTRRLNGKSEIELSGGTLGKLEINNACGDTAVKLDGGSLSSITELIYGDNDTIKQLAANAKRTLTYNSLAFTEQQIASLNRADIFDTITPYASLHLAAGGTGDGTSADSPLGDLGAALGKLTLGGTLTIDGSFSVPAGFCEPAHSGEIVWSGGTLVLPQGDGITLSGPAVFSGVTLEANGSVIDANGSSLTFDQNVATSGSLTVYGTRTASPFSGVTVKGGDFDAVYASDAGLPASSAALLSLSGGTVKTAALKKSGEFSASAQVVVQGAEVGTLDLTGALGSLSVSALSGKIGSLKAGLGGKTLSAGAVYSLEYDKKVFSEELFSELTPLVSGETPDKVVYVRDGGTGAGAFPDAPLGSLKDAFASLSSSGGTVVLCGPLTVSVAYRLPVCGGKVRITSAEGGVDYAKKSGAVLRLEKDLLFSSPVLLEDLTISEDDSGTNLTFSGCDSEIGERVTVTKKDGIQSYPNLFAGETSGFYNESYTFTVRSGSFESLYLASPSNVSLGEKQIAGVLSGGEFFGPVYALSGGTQSGTVELTVNGGIFHAGIYGGGLSPNTSFNGTFRLTINGGEFYGKIAPAFLKNTTLRGEYILALNGGEFAGVTDVVGPEAFDGNMKPQITVSSAVDLFAPEEGESSFDNPVREGADPWVIYQDGYYYFTCTAGASVVVAKAANLADLRYAPLVDTFTPAKNKSYSHHLWSPELHYYGPEVFGEEYAGWYLYVACDDGDNATHRMYVLKAKTDDPQGDYVHPVTGEKNVPIQVVSDTDPAVADTWTIGMTTGIIRDQLYCFWVSEIYEGTTLRYQTLNVSKMKNPWALTGPCSVFCKPTESWEKVGATYSVGTDGKIYPEVVEGIAVVYGSSGETYILYCGSGYWTSSYCLGQLKLKDGADPTEYDSWEKAPQPVLSRNGEANGLGHCCYTTSPDGTKRYIIYHGYLGSASGGTRYMMAEEYQADADGVRIVDASGKTYKNGSGLPTQPPLASVFTCAVNPMPLIKKLKTGWGDAVESFLQFTDAEIAPGKIYSVPAANITLLSGKTYDANEYGEIVYRYRTAGTIEPYTTGMPTEIGTYEIVGTLTGADSYSGLSGSFILTVKEGAIEPTVDPVGGDGPSLLLPILIAVGAILLAAAAVVLIPRLNRKKPADKA